MKKKYFSFIFAFVLLVPCMLLLTACGGKKVQSITVDNMFVGERQDEYQYGTSINDIISTDLTVAAQYDDNSTKVLNSDEYKIEFFKDSQKVEKIKDLPDVGYYSIRVSYDIFMEESYFSIIPSENPYYTVSLSHKSWTYGDEGKIPTVNLANYDLQKGDIVSYYYIEKSIYENLNEQEKKNPSNYANDWANVADGTTTLDAGQYYVFADIIFVNPSNYTGLTVIDDNSLITVKQKTITVTPDDAAGVKALEFDYINSGEATSAGDNHIGAITLDDIRLENYGATISGVEGYFDWANPDETLDTSDDGKPYQIVFIPYSKDNYNVLYTGGKLTLAVSVKKGIVGDSNEMKIYFEESQTDTITYDGQEHSVLLNDHFDIHNYGGKLKNIVTFKNQNGEDVAVRYEELEGGLDALYIDGLKEIGTYQFIVSIVDTANYCWEDGTTEPITFSVKIVGNSDLLDVEGDYKPVNPETDGNQDPQPAYMEYLGKWMNEGKETTAPNYDAQIQIDYKDQNQTLNITGNLNNKYNDVETYNDFITNTTLTHGKDNYVINGKVDTSGLNNEYTVTKNGEATNFVIDANLHSLIMEALGIDLANNSISSEEQIWSVAQDSENLKIKIELNFEDGVTVVHFVFDAEGNFVGHKVSMTSVDGTMSYSIQMKLVK